MINEAKKDMLKRYAVIMATAIVINRSFCEMPNIRAACTPFPGSPNALAYGQGIYKVLYKCFIDIFDCQESKLLTP